MQLLAAFLGVFAENVLTYGLPIALQILRDWMDGLPPELPDLDLDDIEALKDTPPPESYFD